MNKLFQFGLAVLFALGGLSPATRGYAATTTKPVTPASADWGFLDDNGVAGWTTGFESGPGVPPLGTGSVTIELSSAGAGIVFGTAKYQGTLLSSITTLSYSTYTNLSPTAMAFQINYDPDLTTAEATWYGRLTYEPYMNGTVTNGTWQTWDMINGGNGKWWASGNLSSPVDDACPQSTPCTLTALLTLFPNIGIRADASSGIMFKAGSGWNGFAGNADNLIIGIGGNTDTYDFEPLNDVYVDASWSAVTPGTDPDGAGPALRYGIDSFDTIQEGIDAVVADGTVHVADGTYVLSSVLNLNKAGLSLQGTGSPLIQVSGTGERFFITAPGVTIDGFTIEKTDKTGPQNIIYIGASNTSITNNEIFGHFVIGDGDVSRGIVIAAGGFSGLDISGNTIHHLRQPAYISGTHTGTISNNYVYGTKGWVLEGGNLTFTNNTWGVGANANVYDIAILSLVGPSYYTDIVAMSNANNEAVIEDQRVSPAVLSVVYVDAATSFATDLGGRYHPYSTITPAITRVVAGGTIHVAAGTYTEDLTINKALDLLGPNAAVNPNGGTRIAEAIVHPATSNPDPAICTVMAYLSTSDITIKGFTFDGDNPAITSGVMIGTADVDACEILAGYEGMGNITVENNILKNSTYSAIDFYNYTNTSATSGNYILNNLIENVGEATYSSGVGVLLYNNFYADVTGNVLNNVRVGIQTGNYHQANPGTTGSISNNTIHSWRAGIFHNLWYSNASNVPVTNNVIDVVDNAGATRWNGILFSSFSVPATIGMNTITATDVSQQTVGYMIWNDYLPAGLTVTGGTVAGADYGVWINNFAGYTSNASNTSITVDGVSISGASLAGVYVQDDPLNTNNATVQATIKNSPISNSAVGILIAGSDASATGRCNQLTGNTAGVNNTTTAVLNFEKNFWGSATGPSGSGWGSGNTVSTNVDYQPWSVDTSCSSFTSFLDVPPTNWASAHIESLFAAGVTAGCGAGNYCPETIVTRDQMAVFLLKGKHGPGYVPPTATGMFADVPTNYWAAAWIERLAVEGITAGCGNGNYCPTTPVTRDQMAVFLLKAQHGSGYVPPTATGGFLDVPTDYWAAAWIEELALEGITAGCGGGNYCPTTPVTRDQMAVFLVKNFNLP